MDNTDHWPKERATPDEFDPETKNGVHLFGITNQRVGVKIEGGSGRNTILWCDGVTINGMPLGCDEYVEIEAHDFEVVEEHGQVDDVVIDTTLNLIIHRDEEHND